MLSTSSSLSLTPLTYLGGRLWLFLLILALFCSVIVYLSSTRVHLPRSYAVLIHVLLIRLLRSIKLSIKCSVSSSSSLRNSWMSASQLSLGCPITTENWVGTCKWMTTCVVPDQPQHPLDADSTLTCNCQLRVIPLEKCRFIEESRVVSCLLWLQFHYIAQCGLLCPSTAKPNEKKTRTSSVICNTHCHKCWNMWLNPIEYLQFIASLHWSPQILNFHISEKLSPALLKLSWSKFKSKNSETNATEVQIESRGTDVSKPSLNLWPKCTTKSTFYAYFCFWIWRASVRCDA